jgi:very-short-patch-repair endonuclease
MANPLATNWSKLYSNPTRHEEALEPHVAALGRPYRFQHPFWSAWAIADFAFPLDQVVIEVDGESHFRPSQRVKDRERTKRLEAMGWRVFRCTNDEVEEDVEGVIARFVEWRDSGAPSTHVSYSGEAESTPRRPRASPAPKTRGRQRP